MSFLPYANLYNIALKKMNVTDDIIHGSIALHVRRSDKYTEDPLFSQRSFRTFADATLNYIHWNTVSDPSIFIASEDPKTFNVMPKLLKHLRIFALPQEFFVMDGASQSSTFQNIAQNNNELKKRYLQSSRDEGMALSILLKILSNTRIMIFSLSSNMAIIATDLHRNGMFVDVQGRTYCGCGASFCIKKH